LKAGTLRHYCQLHSPTETTDEYGAITETFASYANVWAEVIPLKGGEKEKAQQITADISVRIRIRYRSDVNIEHRVIFGSRIYEINTIVNAEMRDAEIFLYCTELVT